MTRPAGGPAPQSLRPPWPARNLRPPRATRRFLVSGIPARNVEVSGMRTGIMVAPGARPASAAAKRMLRPCGPGTTTGSPSAAAFRLVAPCWSHPSRCQGTVPKRMESVFGIAASLERMDLPGLGISLRRDRNRLASCRRRCVELPGSDSTLSFPDHATSERSVTCRLVWLIPAAGIITCGPADSSLYYLGSKRWRGPSGERSSCGPSRWVNSQSFN